MAADLVEGGRHAGAQGTGGDHRQPPPSGRRCLGDLHRGPRGPGLAGAGRVAAEHRRLLRLPLGVDAQHGEPPLVERVEHALERVAQRLEVAVLAARRLAAVEPLAALEEARELLLAAADLVLQLVRVLDQVLVALEVLRREPVHPEVHVVAPRVRERLLQVRSRLLEVVEQGLAAVGEGAPERDDLQQVELLDAHLGVHAQHLGQVPDVGAVDDHVDVHDRATVGERVAQPRELLLERALGADERVVHLGVGAVDRERDLGEPLVDRAPQELPVGEPPPVGHRLDLPVAGEPTEAHEIHEIRVDRGLAAREDEPRRPLAPTVEDLRLHLLPIAHLPGVGVRVEAEHAVVVAVEGEPYPVALLVGRVLVARDLALADGLQGHRATIAVVSWRT